MKTFKKFVEDSPTMGTGAGIDLGEPRHLFRKRDKRSKWDIDKLFRKANGKTS